MLPGSDISRFYFPHLPTFILRLASTWSSTVLRALPVSMPRRMFKRYCAISSGNEVYVNSLIAKLAVFLVSIVKFCWKPMNLLLGLIEDVLVIVFMYQYNGKYNVVSCSRIVCFSHCQSLNRVSSCGFKIKSYLHEWLFLRHDYHTMCLSRRVRTVPILNLKLCQME